MSPLVRLSNSISAAALVSLATAAMWWCLAADPSKPHVLRNDVHGESQFFLTGQPPKVPARPAELLDMATDSPAPVADLFRALARPSDRVELANGEVAQIEPIGPDTLLNPEFTGTIATITIAEGEKPAQPLLLTRASLARCIPFERQALERITEFENAAGDLPPIQHLTALETALAVTLRFNLSARERPLKGVSRWDALQTELDRKLLEVRLTLFRQRTVDSRKLEDLHFGDELIASYPGNAAVLTEAARQRLRFAASVLLQSSAKQAANNYAVIRQQLEWVDNHLPQSPQPNALQMVADILSQAGQPITLFDPPDAHILRQILVDKASGLLTQAKQAKDDNTAIRLLQSALEMWPRLPGLRDELLKREGHYPILNVGVRTLPEYFSPARAVADSELQALELLFEGLVQTRPAGDGSLAYVPQLAASLPTLTANERVFPLRQTAYWSNGTRVTSADVQKTFELLTIPRLKGRNAELADQIEPIRAGEDPFRVEARLRLGLLDPLAPFTFKVLPREFAGAPLAAADNDNFALTPLGSGPYMLAGRIFEHGRTYLRFVINPHYAARAGSAGPKIREVRFFVSRDPAADFAHKTAPLHLLLDLPTQDLGKLKAAGVRELRTLPTRRVFFLAVNQRDPLLANESLRRALARAINRQQVLADCFGGGRPGFHTAGILAWGASLPVTAAAVRPKGASFHHPLNGPYPAGSWACCTDNRVPATLFDRAAAEAFLQKTSKAEALELELKYPDDDPRVELACKAIASQFADLAGRALKIRLVKLPVHQLKRDLQMRHYQLAYWHHDFPNDAFSLWPLFDPSEEAMTTGSNYLGVKDDGFLQPLLLNAGRYRDFNEVKRLTHDIHDALNERMPLIPLWQLDYHFAVHPQLRLPRIDPLRIFANIDEWELAER